MQVSKLLDEQKEMKLVIKTLKEENKKIKQNAIDTTKYEEWNEDDIINWIFTLENGLFYDFYCDILPKEIKDSQLKGPDLIELNTADLKGFGINVFKHRKILEKHIQKLIQQKNINNHGINDDEGANAPTAYI